MGSPSLPEKARRRFQNPTVEVLLSLVSVWEMAIKVSLGKLRITGRLTDFVASARSLDVDLLPITLDHVLAVEKLPFHHRDPFDRLLASQAKIEKLEVLSGDPIFDEYGIHRVWA
ncbi:MAG: type II toxin-antitoxin system VapC family toxin [Candidatus Riflebacteria bacterium]|nr:type II toxin-antitoxin system VapC family toxin [Candidatus Riflebacteria bacterium]